MFDGESWGFLYSHYIGYFDIFFLENVCYNRYKRSRRYRVARKTLDRGEGS